MVHSGDFTHRGTEQEIEKFAQFLSRQPHPYKIIVCGNHELNMDKLSTKEVAQKLGDGVIVLEDSGATILGIKFWGSPCNMAQKGAYGAPESERMKRWQMIPDDTDVLITHQPPYSVKDLAWVGNRNMLSIPCDLCEGKLNSCLFHVLIIVE